MPTVEHSDRFQTALAWYKTGTDRHNQPVIADTPVELTVRWLYKRREATAPDGTPMALDATVIVDRVIPIGSIMLLMDLEDWNGTGSGSGWGGHDFMEIKTFDETPDVKGREVYRQAGLARFGSTLPDNA